MIKSVQLSAISFQQQVLRTEAMFARSLIYPTHRSVLVAQFWLAAEC